MMSPYEKMAFSLQEAREKAGKTQKDAAEYLGCTYQAISNYERAKTKIHSVCLLQLLLYYKVDIYAFLAKCGFEEMRQMNAAPPGLGEILFDAYVKADDGIQDSVLKLLDITDVSQRSLDSDFSAPRTEAI